MNFKKMIFIFGLLFICFIKVNVVKAAEGENFSLSYDKDNEAISYSDNSTYELRRYVATRDGETYDSYCLDPHLQFTESGFNINGNYYDIWYGLEGNSKEYTQHLIIMAQYAMDHGYMKDNLRGVDPGWDSYLGVQLALRAWRFRECAINDYCDIDGESLAYDYDGSKSKIYSNFIKLTNTSSVDFNSNFTILDESYGKSLEIAKELYDVADSIYEKSEYINADEVATEGYENAFWEFKYSVEPTNQNFQYETTKSKVKNERINNLYAKYDFDDERANYGFYESDNGDGYYYEINLYTNVKETGENCPNIRIEGPDFLEYSCSGVQIGSGRWGTKLNVRIKERRVINNDVNFTLYYTDPREASNFYELVPNSGSEGKQRMFVALQDEKSVEFHFKIPEKKQKTCYIDDDGKFFGLWGLIEESDAEEAFVNQCLCDLANKEPIKETYSDYLYGKLSPNGKNYYDSVCKKEELKTCTIEGGKYYNSSGDLVNEESFIFDCMCDRDTGKRKRTYTDSLYQSLINKDTYLAVCPYKSRDCTPKIEDKVCGVEDEITIGDDLDCVLSDAETFDHIYNTNIYENYSNPDEAKSNYTEYTNDYCNISCGEQITLTLPDKKEAYAGQYFKIGSLNSPEITLKGTKTCRAYLGTDKLIKEEFKGTNTDNPSRETRIQNHLYKQTENSKKEIIYQFYGLDTIGENYDGYGLEKQLDDLAYLYQQFKELQSGVGGYVDFNYPFFDYKDETIADVQTGVEDEWGNVTPYCQYTQLNIEGMGQMTYWTNKWGYVCKFKDKLKIKNNTNEYTDVYTSIGDIMTDIEAKYNQIKAKLKNALDDIKTCADKFSGNEDNYKAYDIQARAEFKYDETYNDLFANHQDDFKYDDDSQTINDGFAGVSTTNLSISSLTSSVKDTLGNYYPQDHYDYTTTITRNYYPNLEFYYMPGSGIITTSSPTLAQKLGTVFPVALNRKSTLKEQNTKNQSANPDRESYSYYINFTKLGYALGGTGVGRLDKFTTDKGGFNYTCYYDVDNDIVRISDEDYDEGTDFKQNYFYRSISLNNVNPQNRTLGKNWNVGEGKPDSAKTEFEKKASVTIKSIEEEAEKIYSDSEPEYSFTLTPESMQLIKKYNQGQEINGGDGYQNFDMEEYKGTIQTIDAAGNKGTIDLSSEEEVGEGKDLKHYEWYKSNFIDVLEAEYKATNVKFDKGRANWTVWRKSDSSSVIGPAWK